MVQPNTRSYLQLPADKALRLFTWTVLVLCLPILYWSFIENPVGEYFVSTDYWHHLATVRSLLANPFSPANPFVVSDDPTRTFTPEYVGLSLLGMIWRATPEGILALAASLATVLCILGTVLFCKSYFEDRNAILPFFVTTLFVWGVPVTKWNVVPPSMVSGGRG